MLGVEPVEKPLLLFGWKESLEGFDEFEVDGTVAERSLEDPTDVVAEALMFCDCW